MSITQYVYIDIETVPSQDPEVHFEILAKHAVPPLDLDCIFADARLKDPDKIAEDLAKKRAKAVADRAAAVDKAAAAAEEELRRTGLDGATGHVVVAGYAVGDDPIEDIANVPATLGDLDAMRACERQSLTTLFGRLEAARVVERDHGGVVSRMPVTLVIVAHNASFDIRFLWQRAIALEVPVPDWWPIKARPWDETINDTMIMWAGTGNRVGLDKLCRALGVAGKGGGIDGSKVWDAIREGRIDEVREYCRGDVDRLRRCHRRLRGLSAEGPGEYKMVSELAKHAAEAKPVSRTTLPTRVANPVPAPENPAAEAPVAPTLPPAPIMPRFRMPRPPSAATACQPVERKPVEDVELPDFLAIAESHEPRRKKRVDPWLEPFSKDGDDAR